MSHLNLAGLPSLRRQHLLSEFAGLKQACPEGILVSLTPDNFAIWSAVLFVRQGPYSPAILRFQIHFPDDFPRLPPLITFTTDIFHPLVTPLTTYTYTTDIQDNGTVSATDAERLPPGGFSLRHGFPEWFRRTRGGAGRGRSAVDGQREPMATPEGAQQPTSAVLANETVYSESATATPSSYMDTHRKTISMYEVFRYVRQAFSAEDFLDDLPLEAAGNPGAWHAWLTHRRKLGKLPPEADVEQQPQQQQQSTGSSGHTTAKEPDAVQGAAATAPPQTPSRRPAQWNWEGVWEDRVKKGVAASLSEPVLYGASGTAGAADEVIRFLAMEEEDVAAIKENIHRTLEHTV